MLGVTIGTGPLWKEIAEVSARQMSAMTGLECVVMEYGIRQYVHPSWSKADVIEKFPLYDSFLVFDADIICLTKWSPELLFNMMGRAFCAVPDLRTEQVYEECERLKFPFPDLFVNGGLTMFGREHLKVWEWVRGCHPRLGKWLEQAALNLALLDVNTETCRLPRHFNFLSHEAWIGVDEARDKGAINYHLCSTKPERVREIQKECGLL